MIVTITGGLGYLGGELTKILTSKDDLKKLI